MKLIHSVVGIAALSGAAYGQCGLLNSASAGDQINTSDMPSSYGVVSDGPGDLVFPRNWGNLFDFYEVGTYVAKRLDVVVMFRPTPVGEPRPAYYTLGGNSAVNVNADCETHEYDIQLTQTVVQSESWSISEEFSETVSEQFSVELGTDKSLSPISMGLSASQAYERTVGLTNTYTAEATIGSGATFTVRDAETPPCHKYTAMPYVDVQDYSVFIDMYQSIHDIWAYYDTTGNGSWDTRSMLSVNCGTGSNGHLIEYGTATVVVSGFSFEDRGASPIPEPQCPCPCINDGARVADGCPGGGGDMDDDGIPDDIDEDMDGDGIGNDHDNDTDGDGIPNDRDDDDDNDGVPDSQDDSPTGTDENDDIDGDGIPNDEDDDIDGDGIPNDEDADMDGDGVDNDEDLDDDADGKTDLEEIYDAIRRFVNWVRDTIMELV